MIDVLSSLFALAGAGFVLVAAIGLLRLPDTLSRMHAVTKAGAFGAALLVLALCLHAPTVSTALKGVLLVAVFYATAPIAGHVLGRAIYRRQRAELRLRVDEWHETAPGATAVSSPSNSTQSPS